MTFGAHMAEVNRDLMEANENRIRRKDERIAELTARLEAAEADTARVDWLRVLLSKQVAVQFLAGPDVVVIEIVDCDGKETAFIGQTLAAAIAAAIAKK